MQSPDASRLLSRAWDASGMEGDSRCRCCEAEAGLHRDGALVQRLRQREARLRWMTRLLAAAFVLLASAIVGLLVAVVLGRGGHSADGQAARQSDSPPSEPSPKEQHVSKNPSALLTVPDAIDSKKAYLEWESQKGNAFCHGGFSYSNGRLVVPRHGVYRVFMQITFESKTDECEGELMLTNKVSVITESYNETVPFLSAVDTVLCHGDQHWRKSLYTAGSFSLEANSVLLVTSSHPELIVNEEYLVFFGAELLPQ